jgi:hypothetical protein
VNTRIHPKSLEGAADTVAVQSIVALAIALAAGAAALVSPALALLSLAALAARALLRADQAPHLDAKALAGPALAACVVGAFAGLAGAIGVLFVWRLHADARWSVNEARRLTLVCGRPAEASWRALVHAWLTPAYGLMLVAFTSPHIIAGLPLDLPHVPVWAPFAAGCVAAGAVFDWALRRATDWRLGELSVAPSIHLLTHHALFLLAFGAMFDLSAGVVALAAWRLARAAPFKAAQASLTAVP